MIFTWSMFATRIDRPVGAPGIGFSRGSLRSPLAIDAWPRPGLFADIDKVKINKQDRHRG
jgi:hypothetical protein